MLDLDHISIKYYFLMTKIYQTYIIDRNIEIKIKKKKVDELLKQMVFNFKLPNVYNTERQELFLRDVISIKKCAFNDFEKLTELYISIANIGKLEANCFSKLKLLKRLDITTNRNEIESNAFIGLDNLNHMHLMCHGIKFGADTFNGLSNLNELLIECDIKQEAYENNIPSLFIHFSSPVIRK